MHVRHFHIFEESFRQFSKDSFDVSKMLKIIFVGKFSVDDEGQRCEYFQLLLLDIARCSDLFAGRPNCVLPLHNVDALSHKKCYVVGGRC